MTKIKKDKKEKSNFWQEFRERVCLTHFGMNVNQYSYYGKQYEVSFKKENVLNIALPYDQFIIPLLSYICKENGISIPEKHLNCLLQP